MMEKIYRRKLETRQITMIGMLFAVTIVLGATGLGFIPVPPFKTTIMHIPVIIGGIVGGPIVGGLLGLLFGIFSIIQAINTPMPGSFIFMNPIVAVLPRVLIGIVAYYVYVLARRKSEKVGVFLGIVAGSYTNTIGVVGMIYIFYLGAYANAYHISESLAAKTLLLLILNGFISAGVALLISLPVIMIVKKLRR